MSDNAEIPTKRLTSLRQTATSATPRRKFVPKVSARRSKDEIKKEVIPSDSSNQAAKSSEPKKKSNDSKGGRGSRGGRGARGGRGSRGRGRGRGGRAVDSAPKKVAFVGAIHSGAPSMSAKAPVSLPSSTQPQKTNINAIISAADGCGINMADDGENIVRNVSPKHKKTKEIDSSQWPPVIKSAMQPISLPFGKPPADDSLLSSGAGALFTDADGNSVAEDDTLFFFQLPTRLPYGEVDDYKKENLKGNHTPVISKKNSKKIDPVKSEKMDVDSQAKSCKISHETPPFTGRVYDDVLKAMPGGYMGKIQIHKSGKCKLRIGDVSFDLSVGQAPSFSQEVFSVNSDTNQLSMLGEISNHLVVTPDFDCLLP